MIFNNICFIPKINVQVLFSLKTFKIKNKKNMKSKHSLKFYIKKENSEELTFTQSSINNYSIL